MIFNEQYGEFLQFSKEPLKISLSTGEQQKSIKVGREPNSNNTHVVNPELKGVSRQHAEITIYKNPQTQENLLKIKGLPGTHTYVDQHPLQPGTEYILRSGNVVRLGEMGHDQKDIAYFEIIFDTATGVLTMKPLLEAKIASNEVGMGFSKNLRAPLEQQPQQRTPEGQIPTNERVPKSLEELQNYISEAKELSDLFFIDAQNGKYSFVPHSKFEASFIGSDAEMGQTVLQKNTVKTALNSLRETFKSGKLTLSSLRAAFRPATLETVAETMVTTFNAVKRPIELPDFTPLFPDNQKMGQALNHLLQTYAHREHLLDSPEKERLLPTKSYVAMETGQGYENVRQGKGFDAAKADGSIAMVADGAGVEFHSGQMAWWAVNALFPQLKPDTLGTFVSTQDVQNNVFSKMEEIQRGMHVHFPNHPRGETGTTVTAAVVGSKEVVITHVGDSLGFKLRENPDGRGQAIAKRLTADHSDPEQRNQINKSFSPTSNVRGEVEVTTEEVETGDVIMLFSDGLEKYFALPIGKAVLAGRGIYEPASTAPVPQKLAYERAALSEGVAAAYPIIKRALQEGKDPAQAILNAQAVPYWDAQNQLHMVSARQYADIKAGMNAEGYHDDISVTVTFVGDVSQLEVANTQERKIEKSLQILKQSLDVNSFQKLSDASKRKLLANILRVNENFPYMDAVIKGLEEESKIDKNAQTSFAENFGGQIFRKLNPEGQPNPAYAEWSTFVDSFINSMVGDFSVRKVRNMAELQGVVSKCKSTKVENKFMPGHYIDFGAIQFVIEFASTSPELWRSMSREAKQDFAKVNGVTGQLEESKPNRNLRIALADTIDRLLQ